MALIVDQHTAQNEGGAHRGVITAGGTGKFTFKVSPGRRYNMVVDNNTGGVYDIGYYLFSAEDDVTDSMTRVWAADIEGVTASQQIAASIIGMCEIGIDLTTASSTDITVELRECKM
jgi:hypothetical protein